MQAEQSNQVLQPSEIAHLPPNETFETKRCPLCAEVIQSAAIRCRHCCADLTKPILPPFSTRAILAFVSFTVLTCLFIVSTVSAWMMFSEYIHKIPMLLWRSFICSLMVAILVGSYKRVSWSRSWLWGISVIQAIDSSSQLLKSLSLPMASLGFWGLSVVSSVIAAFAIRKTEFLFFPDAHPPSYIRVTLTTVLFILTSAIVELIAMP